MRRSNIAPAQDAGIAVWSVVLLAVLGLSTVLPVGTREKLDESGRVAPDSEGKPEEELVFFWSDLGRGGFVSTTFDPLVTISLTLLALVLVSTLGGAKRWGALLLLALPIVVANMPVWQLWSGAESARERYLVGLVSNFDSWLSVVGFLGIAVVAGLGGSAATNGGGTRLATLLGTVGFCLVLARARNPDSAVVPQAERVAIADIVGKQENRSRQEWRRELADPTDRSRDRSSSRNRSSEEEGSTDLPYTAFLLTGRLVLLLSLGAGLLAVFGGMASRGPAPTPADRWSRAAPFRWSRRFAVYTLIAYALEFSTYFVIRGLGMDRQDPPEFWDLVGRPLQSFLPALLGAFLVAIACSGLARQLESDPAEASPAS